MPTQAEFPFRLPIGASSDSLARRAATGHAEPNTFARFEGLKRATRESQVLPSLGIRERERPLALSLQAERLASPFEADDREREAVVRAPVALPESPFTAIRAAPAQEPSRPFPALPSAAETFATLPHPFPSTGAAGDSSTESNQRRGAFLLSPSHSENDPFEVPPRSPHSPTFSFPESPRFPAQHLGAPTGLPPAAPLRDSSATNLLAAATRSSDSAIKQLEVKAELLVERFIDAVEALFDRLHEELAAEIDRKLSREKFARIRHSVEANRARLAAAEGP